MLKPSLILTLVLSTLTVYACKSNEQAMNADNTSQNTQEALPAENYQTHCLIDNPEFAQGQPLDEALLSTIKQNTGAQLVRVLKPGQPVTMEYNPQRVNINVDENQKIMLITCG